MICPKVFPFKDNGSRELNALDLNLPRSEEELLIGGFHGDAQQSRAHRYPTYKSLDSDNDLDRVDECARGCPTVGSAIRGSFRARQPDEALYAQDRR